MSSSDRETRERVLALAYYISTLAEQMARHLRCERPVELIAALQYSLIGAALEFSVEAQEEILAEKLGKSTRDLMLAYLAGRTDHATH